MKLSEDELKRLRKLREAVDGNDGPDDDDLEVGNDDPFPDIPDRTEQPSKKKEERVGREEPSSPVKKGQDTPSVSLMEAIMNKVDKFKGISENQNNALDGEDAWADEPPEESRPVLREEVQVKKEPGKINVKDGRFDNVAGLFGGSKKKEQPKIGKLKAEAIEALANAKAEDVRRAAERGESPGEPRVSVTSAELQPHSDIPIPPPPPLSAELETHSGIPIPPPMMESPPAPPLERRATVAMEESSIPSAEKRRTTVIEEPSIPLVEKRKTTVSEIPAAKDNKDLDIVIKDLEHLQQEVSGKIGPKNAKELAGHINKIKEDYNSKSGEEQAQTLQKNLQSLEKWSSEKEKETASKSTWKKIGTVISSCISLVGAKIAGKETENIKNNLAQAMKELKTGGKKEVGEWVSKIKQEATKNQERSR